MMAFRKFYDVDTGGGAVAYASYTSVVSPFVFVSGGSSIDLLEFEGTCNSTSSPFDLQWGQNSTDALASSIMVGSFMEVIAL